MPELQGLYSGFYVLNLGSTSYIYLEFFVVFRASFPHFCSDGVRCGFPGQTVCRSENQYEIRFLAFRVSDTTNCSSVLAHRPDPTLVVVVEREL